MFHQHLHTETQSTILTYNKRLNSYTIEEFQRKPAADKWSIGEVYTHLIRATLLFHLRMVDRCLSKIENVDKTATDQGVEDLSKNEMAPVKIVIPSSRAYDPPMPDSIERVSSDIAIVLDKMKMTMDRLMLNPPSGKLEHPYYGYLDAYQWFQLIGMHWKHHLRQIESLEEII